MDYYISKNDGKYIGPFKKDQLIANGLDLDDLVWRQGLSGWTPANQLPELSDIIGDVPPPMEITLGPERAQQPLVQPVQQTTQQSYGTTAKIKTQLEQLNNEKEELKKLLEQKKTEGNKKLAAARTQRKAEITEKKKQEEKVAKKELAKAKKKTKYDHPVADWRNESIWLLAFVIIHALIEFCSDNPSHTYLCLDAIGAALSITGIIIGVMIRKLNKISYKKDSQSRLKAEKLSYFNGLFVSATAAIGFLIVFVQSAHYVYVS